MKCLLIFTLYLISVKAYPGDNVTISCGYPEELKTKHMFFYKLESPSITELIHTIGILSQADRFSMSDDRSAKVVSVTISDVRESDGGVYYCGVKDKQQSRYSLFTEIQLHITGEIHEPFTIVYVMIIYFSSASIYRNISTAISSNEGYFICLFPQISQPDCDYEEIKDPEPSENCETTPIYVIVQVPTNPSDSINTVYATAQLPTIPPDPPNTVYASAQLPTIPSAPQALCTQLLLSTEFSEP
uniref:Ig-like domain-containing protein n=1 Tax=Electrophorus electricus TaxID=8005 RepID=A0AAY5EE64_ELEEL